MNINFRDAIYEIAKRLGVSTDVGINPGEGIVYHNILKKLDEVPYIPYPVSFATIDVIIWRTNEKGELEILLGQKSHEFESWRLPGGFREPTHTNEQTVSKESFEETTLTLPIVTYKDYIGSYFINDRRYINSCHKVTTSLFAVEVGNDATPQAGDDLARIQWFKCSDLLEQYKTIMLDSHQILFEQFVTLTNEANG